MAMTRAQARGTAEFFGAILLIMAAFSLAVTALTGDPMMLALGLACAVGAIITGLILGLVTAPLLWGLSRAGRKESSQNHG